MEVGMSVRKRIWTNSEGEQEAWIVDYVDQAGTRAIKTFKKKKDADAYHDSVRTDVRAGVHVSPSKSITVKEAADLWIKASEANSLERTTVDQYRQHLEFHINPHIGRMKLTDFNAHAVRTFEDKLKSEVLDKPDRLRGKKRSPAMIRKILVSLGSLLADAHERGLVAHNAVRDLRRNRRRGKDNVAKRQRRKLKVGVDIPTPEEIGTLLRTAKPRWRPLLVIAAFTGLRASELRGLRWSDVDLKAQEIHVRQRADRYREVGAPKTESSSRTVPFGKMVANTLREWKARSEHSKPGDYVFPTGTGEVEHHQHIVQRGLQPAQVAAGVVDKAGKAKYPGLHALRHFYASWCINRREHGGLGLDPKEVQERLGHSSITMTYDVYGHLFPRGNNAEELDAAEGAILANH
jgi:integrase